MVNLREASVRSHRGRLVVAWASVAVALAILAAWRGPEAHADGATNGVFEFTRAGTTITEGDLAVVTVKRTQGTQGQQNANYSVAFTPPATSADLNGFGPIAASLTFAAGSSASRTIDSNVGGQVGIETDDNGIVDGPRTVTFTLTGVSGDQSGDGELGAQTTFTLTILDNDGPPVFSFSADNYNVTEGPTGQVQSKTVQITVNRSGGMSGTVDIDAATSPGTAAAGVDYETKSLNVPFPSGITSASFTIKIFNDDTFTGTRSFNITLSNPSDGGSISGTNPATVTITDDDSAGAFAFTNANFTVVEGNSGLLNISRTGGSAGAVKVTCTRNGGTADGGVVASPETITFAAGQTSGSCSVPTTNEAGAQGARTAIFDLSINDDPSGTATLGAQDSTTLTINDSGGGTFQFSSATYSVAENVASHTFTVTVNRSGTVTGGASVDFAVAPGATTPAVEGVDFNGDTGTLNFGNNETSKTFTVDVLDDDAVDGPKTVALSLSNPSAPATVGAQGTAVLTITDNEAAGPTVTQVSPSGGPTAGGTTVTVTGTNFVNVQQVMFGDLTGSTVNVIDANSLTVHAPAHAAGTVDVTVVTTAGSSPHVFEDSYTFTDGPVVTDVSPATGPSGKVTFVTITGQHLLAATSVTFGGLEATFTPINDTTISAAAPATGAIGTVDVLVTSPGGTSPVSPDAKFTYTGAPQAPTITALDPAFIPMNTGGQVIEVTGTGFTGTVTVSFGGIPGTNVTVDGTTTLHVTAPMCTAPGIIEVIVTAGGGTSSGAGTANDLICAAPSGSVFTNILYFRWTLLVWTGIDGYDALAALKGQDPHAPDNPATNDVSGIVSAIYRWSPSGEGCQPGIFACWLAFFPAGVGVPGANDFTTFKYGEAYWFAIVPPGPGNWSVLAGP